MSQNRAVRAHADSPRHVARWGAAMLCVAVLGAAPSAAGEVGPPAAKTLHRVPDPVIVSGGALTGLAGQKLDRLGLFALGAAGTLVPIPFQIDEKTADGTSYVYAAGKEANASQAKGALGAHDELVFLAGDSGGRLAPGGTWPATAERGTEIEVRDPVDGGVGWTYLFAFASAPPKSDSRYVQYDRARDVIEARSYSLGYTPGHDRVYFSSASVPTSAGGTGANFVDRLKLRTYVKTLLWFSVSFDEDEWDDEVTAYLQGPIRVIRQERNRLTFAGIEVAPTLLVDAMYFPDFHLAPVQVDQTIHFPSFAHEAWFKLAMDWNASAKGMRYYRPRVGSAPGVPDAWHTIDGVTTADERGLDDQQPDWHLVTGTPGTFLWWVEMPPPLVPVTHLTYTDDAATADPPESTPGSLGEIAYKFDLFPLEMGTYHMRLYYMFPPRWEPGAEKPWIDMIKRPVTTTVQALTRS
ncbi:MAG: hypothetical protein U0610_30600 [bacterium]